MRLLIDSLIVVMLIGILVGVLLHHRGQQQHHDQLAQAREALARLHEQVLYRDALASGATDTDADAASHGFPDRLEPAWFGGDVPSNPLAAPDHAWLDVAPDGDTKVHPPDPVLDPSSGVQAGFWYSPVAGVFRARVPAQLTVRATLELYNQVNGVALTSLPQDEDPARRPVRPDWGAIRPKAVIVAAPVKVVRDEAPDDAAEETAQAAPTGRPALLNRAQ